MRNSCCFFVAVALATACAEAAAAANLLPNGDFSTANQLQGWSCLGGAWNSDDAASTVGSGSMALQNSGNVAGNCTSPCIAVRPGAAYSLGGQSRVLFGNPVITFACAQTNTTQCNSFTFDLQGPAMAVGNAWNAVPASASGILANSTLSLKCTLTLGSADLGNVSGHFDNLFFTTDVIFATSFETP